ncbi:hypothetical protein KBA63_00815 [Candidatus Woesebacteria bacterium]|nr:hypothetical protein [Candidatus Woesebacteria bacterium]
MEIKAIKREGERERKASKRELRITSFESASVLCYDRIMLQWNVKKEVIIHLVSTIVVFALICLVKGYITIPTLLPFVIGGAIAMYLPDIDHLIYALYLRPQELTSQRVAQKLAGRNFSDLFTLLYATRDERRELIFHNIFFQLLFIVFAFLVVTSSGSILGRGIVLSFMLHLFVDQLVDLAGYGTFSRWEKTNMVLVPTSQQKLYVYAQAIPILLLGFVF